MKLSNPGGVAASDNSCLATDSTLHVGIQLSLHCENLKGINGDRSGRSSSIASKDLSRTAREKLKPSTLKTSGISSTNSLITT